MSILIKGIDLPKHNEGICVTIWKDGIVYARDIKTDTTIEAEAEAIQMPTPHGRLIDRDDIYIGRWDIDSDLAEQIQNAPTILDEEGK